MGQEAGRRVFAKVIHAKDPSDLEKNINKWLDEDRILDIEVVKVEVFPSQHLVVAVILHSRG